MNFYQWTKGPPSLQRPPCSGHSGCCQLWGPSLWPTGHVPSILRPLLIRYWSLGTARSFTELKTAPGGSWGPGSLTPWSLGAPCPWGLSLHIAVSHMGNASPAPSRTGGPAGLPGLSCLEWMWEERNEKWGNQTQEGGHWRDSSQEALVHWAPRGVGAGVWGLALKSQRGTRTSGLTLTNRSTLSPGGHGWWPQRGRPRLLYRLLQCL